MMRNSTVDQSTINIIFTAIIGAAGWFARQLWEAVRALKEDLHQIEVDLPIHYVRREELDKRMDHIEAMFQRIYDKIERGEGKLNEKADR